MADDLTAPFSIVASRLLPGGTPRGHERLGGGVSAEIHRLDVDGPGGCERFVVRRHRRHDWKSAADDVTEIEFRLLQALHEADLPVPRPCLLDTSCSVLPTPYFVMSWVEGTTTISDAELDPALRQMAGLLARLHSLSVPSLELPTLPTREDPVDGALQCLPDAAEWRSARSSLASYRVEPVPPSLLHGDFWPGNLIWAEGRLAAVIDWEDAALGPAASDVACCRAELAVMFGEAAPRAFLEHYRAAARRELPDLALWDLYVSVAALATMHEWGLAADVEANRREETRAFAERAAATLTRSS